jgi:tRNA threonylcarbamoyladenosine biosynthesis protein TsaB
MPRALAIETSGRTGTVALVEDQRVLVEDEFPHGLQHAAEMVPRIDRLCRERGWSAGELRELYVSAGPGSFTGLRIGITLAKTLAFATGARIVAVPSIHVLARNAPPEAAELVIVLDAKRGQVFTARLTRSSEGWAEAEPAHLDDLASMLARARRPVYLLGDGIPHHRQFIPADDPGIRLTEPETWRPRAAAVAEEGIRRSAAGMFADLDRLLPIYIRKPEAEEKWEQSHGR